MSRLDTRRLAAIVFVVTGLLFAKTVAYEFVCVDDPDYVLQNAHMKDGLTLANVRWAFESTTYAANWHPGAWLSHMADVSLYKALARVLPLPPTEEWDNVANPVGRVMHAHNVLLHAANAALLFLLLAFVCRDRLHPVWPLVLTLFWAIHPLRTEVVCWISERKELVSCFWMLVTLWLWMVCERTWLSCALAFLSCALAMLGKPVAVSLPALLFAWDWAIRGRPKFLGVLPFFALSAATCLMTMQAQSYCIALGDELTPAMRLEAIFAAPLVYLGQTVWPAGLSLLYNNVRDYDWALLIPGFLLVGVILLGCGFWLVRRFATVRAGYDRWLDIFAFAVAWLYVGLMPMLGIVKVAGQEHSDRYTYWVGCGLSFVAALALAELKPSFKAFVSKLSASAGSGRDEWPEVRKTLLVCGAAALFALGVACDSRAGCWRDALTIFRDTMAKSLHPEFVGATAALLEKLGPDGRREAESWLRECASRQRTNKSYLELAKFILRRRVSETEAKFGMKPYAEAELLLKQILEDDPNHAEAKTCLKELEDFWKRQKEGACTRD